MPRKPRRRSWGSITEVSRGKRYVVRWTENTENGRKRMSKTLECTYAEAAFWLDRKHVEVGTTGKVPTIRQCYELWYLPWLERQVEEGALRQKTADSKIRKWETVIDPFLGSSCIDSVDVVRTQRWLLDMPRGGAETVLTILRKIDALAFKYISHTRRPLGPDIEYEIRRKRPARKSDATLSLSAAADFAQALRGNDMLEAPFIFAAFGGARVTEAAAIKPEEIERMESHGVSAAVFPIKRHTLSTGSGTTDDGELKNEQSVRVGIVPEPFCWPLFEIAARREADGIAWMCDRGDGMPLNGPMLKYYWNRVIEENGLESVPFSNLRRSWRTYMDTDFHIPWNVLEVLMGHKIKGVTGSHYYKPTQEQLLSEVCRCISDADGIFKDMKQRFSR